MHSLALSGFGGSRRVPSRGAGTWYHSGPSPPQVSNPQRWWGHPLAVPSSAAPIFEIPWHNWKLRDQLARQKHPLRCMLPPEPLEKHHIFPQQQKLARWFKLKQIDIHVFTILLPRSFHQRLHSGGPAGGQWNDARRQFQQSNEDATSDEFWRFAFELMYLFRVNGSFMPYSCQD
ncbi:TIGR02269 family lipoprotein [Cystobacter fuscus]